MYDRAGGDTHMECGYREASLVRLLIYDDPFRYNERHHRHNEQAMLLGLLFRRFLLLPSQKNHQMCPSARLRQ